METPNRLLTERDAAAYIGFSRAFLANARSYGDLPGRTAAPPFIKIGRIIRYDLRDLDSWIEAHRKKNGRG